MMFRIHKSLVVAAGIALLLMMASPVALAQTPIPPVDQQAAEDLWTTMQDAEYATNWATVPGKGTFYQGISPHGALLSTYLNPPAADAQESPPGEMPDGAIIVKENYQPDQTLVNITVMQKRAGYDAEHGDWFWAAFAPDGTPVQAGQVESCISCHGAMQSNDYVFTFLVAPIEVADQPATDEDNATAEELWSILQDADYQANWSTVPGLDTFYRGQPPHGALLSTYLDPLANDTMEEQPGEMPDGAVIVKENYQEDQTLVNITVMQKRAGYNPDQGDWFWAAYGPDGSVAMAGKSAYCINCHGAARSNDFIYTFPVAPIEVAAAAQVTPTPAATPTPGMTPTPGGLPVTGGVLPVGGPAVIPAAAGGLLALSLGAAVVIHSRRRPRG